MTARARVQTAVAAAGTLALAASLALPVRAQSGPAASGAPQARAPKGDAASGLVDGGTIRASGIVVPQALKDRRAPKPDEPPPLLGIAPPDVLEALGEFRPQIGAWAEYSITAKKQQLAHVLISVLPPPMPDGSYWLEIDTVTDGTLPVALRLLAKGNPARASAIERAIVYVAGQNLVELPVSVASDLRKRPEPARSGAEITTVHGVKLKVPGGVFTADRIRIVKGKETDTVWRSDDVPLFGLVKSEGAGRTTVLTASGHTGAHTLISAEIQDEAIPPGAGSSAAEPDGAQGNGSDSK